MESSISSLGFGWVRHVNLEDRKIHLHSSLDVPSLISLGVNCIVVGMIPIPDQIAFSSQKSVDQRPYVHLRDQDNLTANSFKVIRRTPFNIENKIN